MIEHALKVRRSILRRNARLLNDLIRQYAAAFRELKSEIRRFQEALIGLEPTAGQLANLASLQNLADGVEREMNAFARELAGLLDEAARLEMEQAGVDAMRLVQLSLPGMDPAKLTGTWAVLAPEQVYAMYGFTDPQGPLYAMLKGQFGKAVAKQLREALLRGYIRGMNPRRIARLMAEAKGVGLDWALNAARTACLWSYRTASNLNYLRNSHVVKGWLWYAQLDDRVCLSCVNQHGSEHPLSEILADHHRGRCTPLPITRTYAELGIDGDEPKRLSVKRGEDWFRGLPALRQRGMMGPAMYAAWRDQAFDFSQLSRVYNDKIYGRMIRQASLKEILGAAALKYYDR